MAKHEIKRTEKGHFPPGVSGNPSGKRKDGQPRAPKPSPITDMRELLEVSQHNDDVQAMVSPVLGTLLTMAQPLIMQLALERAKKDNRILAILLQHTLNQMDKHNAKSKDGRPKDLNQLEMQFEELKQNDQVKGMFNSFGIDLESLNLLELSKSMEILQYPADSLSLPTVPAHIPENSTQDHGKEIEKAESENKKRDD